MSSTIGKQTSKSPPNPPAASTEAVAGSLEVRRELVRLRKHHGVNLRKIRTVCIKIGNLNVVKNEMASGSAPDRAVAVYQVLDCATRNEIRQIRYQRILRVTLNLDEGGAEDEIDWDTDDERPGFGPLLLNDRRRILRAELGPLGHNNFAKVEDAAYDLLANVLCKLQKTPCRPRRTVTPREVFQEMERKLGKEMDRASDPLDTVTRLLKAFVSTLEERASTVALALKRLLPRWSRRASLFEPSSGDALHLSNLFKLIFAMRAKSFDEAGYGLTREQRETFVWYLDKRTTLGDGEFLYTVGIAADGPADHWLPHENGEESIPDYPSVAFWIALFHTIEICARVIWELETADLWDQIYRNS